MYRKMIILEYQYADKIEQLVEKSELTIAQNDRTGTGTFKSVGVNFSCDLEQEPFPVLHGKKINPKNAIIEMLWMLKGDTNVKYLKDNGVNYWYDWANPDGTLGKVYGHQMRNFNGIDQVLDLADSLINNFDSRRHIVSLWNPSDLKEMNLPPCHLYYQLVTDYDENGEKCMDICGVQRSGDSFLGIPYNFLLFTFFGKVFELFSGIKLRQFNHFIPDFHLYSNHIEGAKKYLEQVDENDKVTNYSHKLVNERPYVSFDMDSIKHILPSKIEDRTREDMDKLIDFLYHNPHVINVHNYTPDDHDKFIKAPIAV